MGNEQNDYESEDDRNIFAPDVTIERLVFVEEDNVIDDRPQRVSDLPPRPLPHRIENSTKEGIWVPGKSSAGKKSIFSRITPFLARTLAMTAVILTLGGIVFVVYQVFLSYTG